MHLQNAEIPLEYFHHVVGPAGLMPGTSTIFPRGIEECKGLLYRKCLLAHWEKISIFLGIYSKINGAQF